MLRHLTGLLVGLLVTPLLWAGAAWSVDRLLPLPESPAIGDSALLGPLGALLGTGILAGVLAATRISPLASFVPGVALVAYIFWPLVHAGSAGQLLPQIGITEGAMLHPIGPGLPLGLVLGVLLLFASFPPSRWRARREQVPVPSPYTPAPYEPAYEPDEPEYRPGRAVTPAHGWNPDTEPDHEPVDSAGFRAAGREDSGGAATTAPFERRPGGYDGTP